MLTDFAKACIAYAEKREQEEYGSSASAKGLSRMKKVRLDFGATTSTGLVKNA